MAAKKAKLREQFSEDAAKEGNSENNASSSIFHGVSIFVNGYTGMDSSAALLGSWLEQHLIWLWYDKFVWELSMLKASSSDIVTSNGFTQ
jgi:hypothetical protein